MLCESFLLLLHLLMNTLLVSTPALRGSETKPWKESQNDQSIQKPTHRSEEALQELSRTAADLQRWDGDKDQHNLNRDAVI
jgi:hypothetical protein